MRHHTDEEIRHLIEGFDHMRQLLCAVLTERVINFGLRHGLSLQELQNICPRKEDGSPDSLAGQVLDALIAQEHG